MAGGPGVGLGLWDSSLAPALTTWLESREAWALGPQGGPRASQVLLWGSHTPCDIVPALCCPLILLVPNLLLFSLLTRLSGSGVPVATMAVTPLGEMPLWEGGSRGVLVGPTEPSLHPPC